MSAQLALKREGEAIVDIDCQNVSMSIAGNTPIEELVLEDEVEVCSAMPNKAEFVHHKSYHPDFAAHRNTVPRESASVATQGSQRRHNNPLVFSIKSYQESLWTPSSCLSPVVNTRPIL